MRGGSASAHTITPQGSVEGLDGKSVDTVARPLWGCGEIVDLTGAVWQRGRHERGAGTVRDAWFVAAVTVATAVRHPRHSRPARALGLLALAGGLAGALLAGPDRIPYGIGLGLAAAVGWWLLSVVVGTLVAEGPGFARATRVFRIRDADGRAMARVRESDGTWHLSSVAAWPPGRGLGERLMGQVTAAADAAGRAVELSPSSAPVARWYGRYGFVPRGRLLVRPPGRRADPDPHLS